MFIHIALKTLLFNYSPFIPGPSYSSVYIFGLRA